MLFQVCLVVRFMMFVHYFRSGGTARFVPPPDGIGDFFPSPPC